MGYADHLRGLLHPLGVYRLDPGSLSGGELEALGAAFDALYEQIGSDLTEALPLTAQAEGLQAYESLFGYPLVLETLPERREAVLGLLRMPSGGPSPDSISDAGAFCGSALEFGESELPESLSIVLDDAALTPQQRPLVLQALAELMPAHLELAFA